MKNLLGSQAWIKWISSQPLWLRALIMVSAGALALVILLLVLSPPGFSGEDPSETSYGAAGIAIDLILKLGFIIVLIFVTMNLLSRLRSGSWVQQSRKVQIIETTNLSQRQTLHIIKIANKHYLIGATDQGISLLTELDQYSDPEFEGMPDQFTEILNEELAASEPGENQEND